MNQVDLKLSFANAADTREFLRFLRYLEWCGDVGHSTGVTVNADGDGCFRFAAKMKTGEPDVDDTGYVDLKQLIDFDDQVWNKLKREHRDMQRIKEPEHRDHNEFSFSMGD